MQPFELVITIIIAEVACIPMNEPGVPIYHGIIPIVTLVAMHFVISLLSRKSRRMRKLFSGRPIIVVDKDGINYKNLKLLNMDVNDIIETARSNGYPDLQSLNYMIFETNGAVSIIPTADADDNQEGYLPIPLIIDGKHIDNNLTLTKITRPQLTKKLSQLGLRNIKDVLLLDIRQDGSIYVQPKRSKYLTGKLSVAGGW